MHICTRLFSPLLILASLVACTGEEPGGASFSRTSASGSDRNTPCFNNSCAQLEELLTVPDAENMIFSDTGRLFVSGGQAVIEVVRMGNSFAGNTVSESACNFTGLAIARNTLYANCGDGTLWAGSLDSKPVKISRIFNYDNMGPGQWPCSKRRWQNLICCRWSTVYKRAALTQNREAEFASDQPIGSRHPNNLA
jgi:hypothetical protein